MTLITTSGATNFHPTRQRRRCDGERDDDADLTASGLHLDSVGPMDCLRARAGMGRCGVSLTDGDSLLKGGRWLAAQGRMMGAAMYPASL